MNAPSAAGRNTAAVLALALSARASSSEVPSADSLLIAVETEITQLFNRLDDDPHSMSEEESNTIFHQAVALDDYVAAAPPTSLADCAVKMRRVLDRTTSMVIGSRDSDVVVFAQVLDYIETVTGAPNHPTRPIARSWDDLPGGAA